MASIGTLLALSIAESGNAVCAPGGNALSVRQGRDQRLIFPKFWPTKTRALEVFITPIAYPDT
jgi:hypothetical protein